MTTAEEELVVDLETAWMFQEAGAETFTLCMQCAQCTATCPWNRVSYFDPRRMLAQARLGLADLEDEIWWMCATCRACMDRCPMEVDIIGVMKSVRSITVGYGAGRVLESVNISMKNIAATGNPQGESEDNRADWTEKASVPVNTLTNGEEQILYFSCCVPAYDAKVRRMATSLTALFEKAGVPFGILGTAEKCCGESVRKAGNEQLWTTLAQTNIQTFQEHNVKTVVVSSPHCFHTFKNEYPELEGNFEVMHYTQFLLQLLKEGKLELKQEINKRVTYHDPCYLGRHNEIYEPPRELLQAIPGLEFVELPNCREDSICCGAGGGRVWAETKMGERFSDLRIQQSIDVGAEILAVACPYCMLMFDDSVLTMKKEEELEIKDISELILEALG
jgi:Fe-S oxidoreductase